MKTMEGKKILNAQKSSNNNAVISNNENEMITEKERFTRIIQTHLNYLIELKQQKSAKLLREHRARIMQSTQGQLYASYLDKHLNYKEFRSLLDTLRNRLSWEAITGVKQLSIFDEYSISNE